MFFLIFSFFRQFFLAWLVLTGNAAKASTVDNGSGSAPRYRVSRVSSASTEGAGAVQKRGDSTPRALAVFTYQSPVQVLDTDPGTGHSSPSSLYTPTYAGDPQFGNLYFTANNGQTGSELWKYQPLTGDADIMADIKQGPDSSDPYGIFANNQGNLFFGATDGVGGKQLFQFDTTTNAATKLTNVNPTGGGLYPDNFCIDNQRNLFYFSSESGSFAGSGAVWWYNWSTSQLNYVPGTENTYSSGFAQDSLAISISAASAVHSAANCGNTIP